MPSATTFTDPNTPVPPQTTASSLLNQGNRFDPNSLASITAAGNAAVGSSAPPYTPLIGNPAYLTSAQYNNAFNPYLPYNEQFQYNPIVDTSGTELSPFGAMGNMNVNAAQANPYFARMPWQTGPQQYNPFQATAAQGTVDPNSMIQNQFNQLMSSNKDQYGVPDWARTAVTAANQQMAAAGLGNSTMAAGATTAAILNTALPMAAANAQVVAQLNSQNLSNRQQTMLSNTAWLNAAAQFNASSRQQNDQFFASLTTDMSKFNASQANTMRQFNAGQLNTVRQFNAQLNSQRQEFTRQNQLLVNQSNVQWRRAINTANTAGLNAANQANVANLFNMSQNSLNNLWQQARDEASWALTSSENSQNRALSLVNSALNRQTSLDILNTQLQASMFGALGQFGANLLGSALGGAGGLFGSSSSSQGGDYGGGGSGSSTYNLGGASGYYGGGGYAEGGMVTNIQSDVNTGMIGNTNGVTI